MSPRLIISLLLIAGCGADRAAVDETEAPLTQAYRTRSFAGLVLLSPGGTGFCTGTMLSEHWILTAAHCVASFQSAGGELFVWGVSPANVEVLQHRGPWEGFRYPSWSGSGDHEDDVGLIFLGGSGVDLTLTGRALLDTGPPPNYGQRNLATIAGYGQGTEWGGSSSCPTGGTTNLRQKDSSFTWWSGTIASFGSKSCAGDSGGAMLYRDLTTSPVTYVQAAIIAGNRCGLFGCDSEGPLVFSFTSWIDGIVRSRTPFGFYFSNSAGTAGGHNYRQFAEGGFVGGELRNGNNYCLTATGRDGASVLLKPCVGSAEQAWWHSANGEIRPFSAFDQCLEAADTGQVDGEIIRVGPCGRGLQQKWRYESTGTLHAGNNYGKCLDRVGDQYDGNPIQLWGCNWTPAQYFHFSSTVYVP